MTGRSNELYDYDAVRARPVATVFRRGVTAPVIVLGSRQDPSQVVSQDVPLRQRRGGGGAVLMGPGDLWLDFWIPTSDERFRSDVRAAALLVGSWWRGGLASLSDGDFVVHEGAAGAARACFGATGDGEVERVDATGRRHKVVGLTQWRVREGSFVSTVLHAHSTSALATLLRDGTPFEHDSLDSLGLTHQGDALVHAVVTTSGPWASAIDRTLP